MSKTCFYKGKYRFATCTVDHLPAQHKTTVPELSPIPRLTTKYRVTQTSLMQQPTCVVKVMMPVSTVEIFRCNQLIQVIDPCHQLPGHKQFSLCQPHTERRDTAWWPHHICGQVAHLIHVRVLLPLRGSTILSCLFCLFNIIHKHRHLYNILQWICWSFDKKSVYI